MEQYSVKKVAKMSGVSVRTLHYYDKIGLLKPSVRTEARYRQYGERELLRLQQILFYRELDFSLKEIMEILDNPDFDVLVALNDHKHSLRVKIERMDNLLVTIDKTICKLKNDDIMKHPEELYEGINPLAAKKYREEAIEKYGEKMVKTSEEGLLKMGKIAYSKLRQDFEDCNATLFSLMNESPKSEKVQDQIAQHYKFIRQFWGTVNSNDKQAEAYAGLGQLYVDDEQFTMINGSPQPKFAIFLRDAMTYFAKHRLG